MQSSASLRNGGICRLCLLRRPRLRIAPPRARRRTARFPMFRLPTPRGYGGYGGAARPAGLAKSVPPARPLARLCAPGPPHSPSCGPRSPRSPYRRAPGRPPPGLCACCNVPLAACPPRGSPAPPGRRWPCPGARRALRSVPPSPSARGAAVAAPRSAYCLGGSRITSRGYGRCGGQAREWPGGRYPPAIPRRK